MLFKKIKERKKDEEAIGSFATDVERLARS